MSATPGAELILTAPAKLNLFLKIVGKRPDGFHEIDTVMQSIDLCDTLRFRSCDERRLSLRLLPARRGSTDVIPTDDSNLILKAARLLQKSTETTYGAEITLVKRIPSQAGLGGGSADAGITLRGLNRLWKLNLPDAELARLAGQLGSDIPFFATGATLAQCVGRGEQIHPARGCRLDFVVAKPSEGLATARVYSSCAVSAFRQSGKEVLTALHAGNLAGLKCMVGNGLESTARDLSAAVDELLRVMKSFPFVSALLSGSGSACFGICRSRRQAIQLAQKLRGMTGIEVFVAQSRV